MADRETAEVTAQANEKLAELSRLLRDANNGFTETNAGAAKLNAGFHLASQVAGGLTKAFTDGAAAMYRGEKGLKAFNSSVDAGADALIALAGALALLGGPVTLVAAGLTAVVAAGAKYVKASNEQSDNLYKAFQGLSRAGGVGADGLQSLYVDMQKLGLGVQDLDKMVELVSANSADLALLGGSVNEGRKQFSNIGKELDKYNVGLRNAGMTQDEINAASMGYLRLQSKIGLTQKKSADELAESTHKYLLEQDALTKLTGMNRKEQEDAREAIRSDEAFAAKLEQVRQSGPGGEERAQELENTYLMLLKTSKTAARGFADISSGNLQTEAAQQEMRVSQGESMRIAQAVADGQLKAAQGADAVAEAHTRTVNAMGVSQGLLRNYNKTFGNVAEDYALRSKLKAGGFEKEYDKIIAERKKQGVDDGKAQDSEQQLHSELEKTQQDSMKSTQDFVRYGVKPATEATAGFAKALNYVTKLLPGAGTAGQGAAKTPTAPAAAPTAPAAAPAAPAAPAAKPPAAAAPAAAAPAVPPTAPPTAPAPAPAAPSAAAPAAPSSATQQGTHPPPSGTPTAGERPNLSSISSKSGKSTMVNSEYAPRFQKLIDYLDGIGYNIYSLGGYVDRDVRGQPGVKSVHAKGGAIDINPATNPYGSQRITDMPEEIGQIAAGLGLGWGANWSSIKDAMHFSVAKNEGGELKLSDGGVATGPNSGYPATLHGTEAVIPLSNSQGNFVELFEVIAENSKTTTMLLEDLIKAQKNSVEVQEKILRVQT